jgi:tRNA(Ile)-lysidine synthase
MTLIASLQKTIAVQKLFTPTDLVLVAISGGPDSTSLLHALHILGYRLHAAHLNHGMRGEEADLDERAVGELCQRLGIPFTSTKRDVPAIKHEMKVSKQMAARKVRYDFLEETAAQVNASCIATAHNLDDRIETLLLNMIRGSGTEGLKGIPYRRAPYVRPLLDVPRSEIEYYCEENSLVTRIDSSNNSPAYARNNVRRELLPYLERRYNESVRQSLLRLSQIASDESDFLQDLADKWLDKRACIHVDEFIKEPPALQRRILRELLRAGRQSRGLTDISHDIIERIRLNASVPFATMLPGGDWIATGDGKTISLNKPFLEEDHEEIVTSLPIDKTIQFLNWELRIGLLASDVDAQSLIARTWRDGDRIKTQGGTRKLQDVFTDAKTPRDERRKWPVIADKDGIIAVPNLVVAARARGSVIQARHIEQEEEIVQEA